MIIIVKMHFTRLSTLLTSRRNNALIRKIDI